jgi:hypothetical protein
MTTTIVSEMPIAMREPRQADETASNARSRITLTGGQPHGDHSPLAIPYSGACTRALL